MTRGLMAGLDELNIRFLPGGGRSVWCERTDGTYAPGLPERCPDVEAEFSLCEAMLSDRYQLPDGDIIDLASGWADDDARRLFVTLCRELEEKLQRLLGQGWDVTVSRQPGVVEVRLAGDYGVDWPNGSVASRRPARAG